MLNLNTQIGLSQTGFKASHIVSDGLTPELKNKLEKKGYTLQTTDEFEKNPAKNPAIAVKLDGSDEIYNEEFYGGNGLAALTDGQLTTNHRSPKYIGHLEPFKNIVDAYKKQAVMIRTGLDAFIGTKLQLQTVFQDPDNFTTSEDLIKKIDKDPDALN